MGIIVVSALTAIFCIFALKFFNEFWKLHKLKIPELNDHPIFIKLFYPLAKLGMMSANERFETLAEYSFRFPNMVKGWLGFRIAIVVNSPEKIQKILMSQKCLEKWNLFYGLIGRSSGLIAASSKKKWKEHRKFFNFSFSFKVLESFTGIFVDQSKVLCQNLKGEAGNGREFDFAAYSKRFSFDILCGSCLGFDTNEMKTREIQEIFEAYET
jgi:cytochrome P450